MNRVNIKDMNYENAEVNREAHGAWVLNLQYPVSQKDLDALCQRLPRFRNHMGDLYLMQESNTETHTVAQERQCDAH